MRILKFGGTSVGTAERIQSIATLVSQRTSNERIVVVVSALTGVTNELLDAARRAGRGERVDGQIDTLAERHCAVLRAVVSAHEQNEMGERIGLWLNDLRSLLHGVSLVREASPRVLDAILAYGELFSATLVAGALRAAGTAAVACDARALIVTDDTFGHAAVERASTDTRIRAHQWSGPDVQVVTGFIAATADGTTTTLGRGGSDYTATILGAALQADAVEIWTDVDGVMSADPRLVPQAFSLPSLSYAELMELSHFGAKVVYPPSVGPARAAGVPLVIRNTLKPSFAGTWVWPPDKAASAEQQRRGPVCGISAINQVVLCRLDGAGMVGVAGIATRLFGALAREGISVILISQASSEHSICFAIDPDAAQLASRRVDAEFELERRAGAVERLFIEDGYSVIAAVGDGMKETPGIAGRVFDVLGRNGINVRAIAQGSSELNISCVIRRSDETRALRLIHDAFFFPRTRAVQIFVAGTGRVGAALLDQMAAQSEKLADRLGLVLTVAGVARQNCAVINTGGIPLEEWRQQLAGATEPTGNLLKAALQSASAHRVFVDCTASSTVSTAYEELLRKGVAIVSANKIALSGTLERYQQLRLAARRGNGLYSETTVGAGLPVLRPIADLVATGDVVQRIDGVLSGTLSFIFAQLMQGMPFSMAVRTAYDRGFTEPDPRDDLSGLDVARKLLILGREAGFDIEPDQVRRESVLPGQRWAEMSIDEFWRELPALDDLFNERRRAALERGATLSFLGSIDHGGAAVAVREIEQTHPCASLSPGDNLIAVTSARYSERPLVIRGPGAGPDVTAAGVFADILRAGLEAT